MKKGLIAETLKLPVYLLMTVSFGASIYLAMFDLFEIKWGTVVILGLVNFSYVMGRIIGRCKREEVIVPVVQQPRPAPVYRQPPQQYRHPNN